MSDLNKAQKGFMITLYILTAFALLVSAFVIYNIVTREKPWTIGVTYASTLTANENNVDICKVTIHDNTNNNGDSLYEIQFNSYTDADGTGVAGFGIQAVGDDWSVWNYDQNYQNYVFRNMGTDFGNATEGYSRVLIQNNSYIFGDVYLYYTGDDGLVYYNISADDLDNYLLIDIDGQFYRLTLKEYSYTVDKDGFWNGLFGQKETRTATYSWFEVFNKIISSAKEHSSAEEYQEFALKFYDLADFLNIEYKDESGQYHKLDDTSERRNYLAIQVEYDRDGVVEAKDSAFYQIANSTTWNYYENLDLDDYWNAYSDIEITEDHISAVYNSIENAYYITLDERFSEYLSTLQMAKISINLNLDNLDYAIYGIDLQNFDFNIESFEISSSTLDDLTIYNQEACSIEPELNLGGAV